MTYIKKLRVQHIRPHIQYEITFSPTVTILTGVNGAGKTSLLEAVYINLQGSSFKGLDRDVLQRGEDWWRIDTELSDDSTRVTKFDSTKQTARKQFTIDGKTTARIPQKHKYPIVLFEPDDLRLLHGSPSRRRQFIDRFISQFDPGYAVALRKYERSLRQRNNLLKQPHASEDQLFAWDISLVEHGSYIISQRTAYIQKINEDLERLYQAISGTKDTIKATYSYASSGDIKQKLLNDLHASRAKDIYIGSTTVGPHRHDITFLFNTAPATSTASRGEVRTIILALKFLEVAILESRTGKNPIILLDDVFSELDPERQNLLTKQLEGSQIIITSATSHAGEELLHHEIN